MRYIGFRKPGGVDVLEVMEGPIPEPGPGQMVLRVRASALNRADTLQRKGIYHPPPGQSTIMGVELAGEVHSLGEGVTDFKMGDRVLGLTNGGAYAEYCVIETTQAVTLPSQLDFVEGAALPEAYFTSHESLVEVGGLQKGQTVLIHAGASGIGTGALQICREMGATALFTTSTQHKIEACLALGGTHGINYRETCFAKEVQRLTKGKGVDLIMDFVGGSYFEKNMVSLARGGCLLLLGGLDGLESRIDLLDIIMTRKQIKGFSMRSQTREQKAGIVRRFKQHWLPKLVAGVVKPVIYCQYPIEEVAIAHAEMETNANIGKIILTF